MDRAWADYSTAERLVAKLQGKGVRLVHGPGEVLRADVLPGCCIDMREVLSALDTKNTAQYAELLRLIPEAT